MPLPAKRCVADNDVVTANSGPEPLGETVHRLAPINTVVVGIDGSGEARRGLLFAADLAETLDADLLVVHAFGLVGSFGDWRDGVHERELQVNTVMVDEWCAPLADRSGLRWSSCCVQGNAVDGVLRAADDVDAGLIVVGSHGAGNSLTPLLGSTSHFIVRNSRRPVIVVPPADNHPHRRGGAGAMSSGVTDA
jgi:nucleotide-binding universal stress UspA family protein